MALTAVISGSQWGMPGQPVFLSGASSTTAGSPIVSYHWELTSSSGNHSLDGQLAEPALPIGIYSVTLEIRDGAGHSAITSARSLEVIDPRELSLFTAPYGYDKLGNVISHDPAWPADVGMLDSTGVPRQIFIKDGTKRVSVRQIYASAAFAHGLYIYRVDDRDGRIGGLRPSGDVSAYRTAALARLVPVWLLDRTAGVTVNTDGFVPGAFYAFVLRVMPFSGVWDPDATYNWYLFSEARLNTDYVPHSLRYRNAATGKLLFQLCFEDYLNAFDWTAGVRGSDGDPLSYDDADFHLTGFTQPSGWPLRMNQRADGLGLNPAPRLSAGNITASEQGAPVRRIGGRNTFI